MTRSAESNTSRCFSNSFPRTKTFVLLVVFALCVGCVARPRLENVIPPNFVRVETSRGTVSLSVDESLKLAPDNGMGSTLSRETYLEAVGVGLVKSGLFDRVVSQGESDFHLAATVTSVGLNVVDRSLGYVLAYDVVAEWKLTRARGGEVLFHHDVTGTGRANFGDAFNGITRNTVARENAARANIAEGIRQLSELRF